MVTAVGSHTKTIKRLYLLQLQVRNLLARTTPISQGSLEKIAGKGIGNQWLRKVSVYGLDQSNRCQVGLELEINWLTHTLEIVVRGEEMTVNKTVFTDECTPELLNAVSVFNQAVNAECLRVQGRVSYAPGVDVARVMQELDLLPAKRLTWAGTVSTQAFGIAELPEAKVRLLTAESDELVPQEQHTAPEKPERKPVIESLFARIKQALGEG